MIKKEMLAILGTGGKELISSGDEIADKRGREKFLKAYDEMNKLEKVSDSKMILHIGKDDWSLPIPIVKKDNTWVFDTKAGKGRDTEQENRQKRVECYRGSSCLCRCTV